MYIHWRIIKSMKITRLTKYGNSMGVRIPKAMLEESGLYGEVKLEAREGKITISQPLKQARLGWSDAYARMASRHDDELLLPDSIGGDMDEADWQW